MNEGSKTLLKYVLNEKPKYDEMYKYIINNIIEPKQNLFINQQILFANIKQLYTRASNLEAILKEIAKEEKL